ncbi:putative efflux system component YknX [Clostridium acetireducens DSM 10703]|jgi:vacuolar-type H+-ATPase subunit E/Vma4|uniref:Putative efflux system component YknX n=1 Tax=Clostridium acetireducens DSM 10703 TaxID=1121290 RepID=A0A1E8EYD9_9CLOT|nr:RND transporter [Clostridium acetireducens]OFI05850.1 putative efflux system component YknX [Clostridium acetireducens DSM 10703]
MSKRKNKLNKKLIIIISLIVFVIAVPLIAFLVQKKGGKEVNTHIISNNIDNATIINGVVSPEDTNSIFLDTSKGNDFSIKVKEGQSIKKGDTLIVYSTNAIESKISSMESEIKNNKEQIRELNKSGAVALKEQSNMLKSTVKSLEDELKELRKQKDSYIIKSSMDGIVSEVNSGNNNPTTPIIVVESNKKIIKGELTEYELPNITLSTPASVSLKALGEKYYNSKIIKIARNPSNNSAEAASNPLGGTAKISNYAITFTIPKDIEGKVQNGFHALVKLGNTDKTITIPKKAVYKDVDKNHKMIWIVKDNKALSKKIKVKDNGADYILLTDIENGTKVIIDAPEKLKEGDEVTLK